MAVVNIGGPRPKYVGSSSDTKPTRASYAGLSQPQIGSTFYEYDTGILYITYDGTNWVVEDNVRKAVLKTVLVKKDVAAAGDYAAEDVVSESATTGTAFTFSVIGRINGGTGLIIKAIISIGVTALTPRCTLYLFNATPSGVLNDNVANTNPTNADIIAGSYIGKIDFPACEDLGGNSEAQATPGNYPGGLPLTFECAGNADDLYGVLVFRDAVTGEVAGMDVTVILTAMQF